jgi:pyridoxine 4-dehydrogenase
LIHFVLLGQFERRYLSENESKQGQTGFDFGKILGGYAKDDIKNKQQVATKFAPYPWRITRGSLVQAARESLKRLEQDKLCVAQLHWSTANYQPLQEGKTLPLVLISFLSMKLIIWPCFRSTVGRYS